MKALTCRQVERMMNSLLDEELLAGDADRVLAHCGECTRCDALMRRSSQVKRMLALLSPPRPAESMWPLIERRIRQKPSFMYRYGFALGASALAVAGIALGLLVGAWFAPPDDLRGTEWSGSRPLADIYLTSGNDMGATIE